MANNKQEHDKQQSFLVLDEVPISLLPSQFIELLAPSQKYPSRVFAKLLKPVVNYTYPGIDLFFATFRYPDGKEVGLYCFPQAIGRNFGIEDYEAPFETVGFVVFVNTEDFVQSNGSVTEEYSAIYWAKRYHLPIVIVVINSTRIERSIEKLSQLIDYSPDMSIVWCDGEMDYDFVQQTMNTIYLYI